MPLVTGEESYGICYGWATGMPPPRSFRYFDVGNMVLSFHDYAFAASAYYFVSFLSTYIIYISQPRPSPRTQYTEIGIMVCILVLRYERYARERYSRRLLIFGISITDISPLRRRKTFSRPLIFGHESARFLISSDEMRILSLFFSRPGLISQRPRFSPTGTFVDFS